MAKYVDLLRERDEAFAARDEALERMRIAEKNSKLEELERVKAECAAELSSLKLRHKAELELLQIALLNYKTVMTFVAGLLEVTKQDLLTQFDVNSIVDFFDALTTRQGEILGDQKAGSNHSADSTSS